MASLALFCHICKTKYTSRQIKEDKVSLHCVPLQEERRKSWIANCGVDLPTRARVCSRHFKPDSFRITGKMRNLMPSAVPMPPHGDEATVFSPLIENSLQFSLKEFYKLIEDCGLIEEQLTSLYRYEQVPKLFYVYLLLDCSISRNLPERAKHMNPMLIWKTFLKSIFYVGHGRQGNRVAYHFYSALRQLDNTTRINIKINNIWASGNGVHVLRCFDNISSEDSKIRKAAIIEVLKKENITNEMDGSVVHLNQFCNTFANVEKLGLALLHKMMRLYLLNGEVPLFRCNFEKNKSINF